MSDGFAVGILLIAALSGGGNTTWYCTLGDRDGKWGCVAAADLVTPMGFRDNPSAQGVVRCP